MQNNSKKRVLSRPIIIALLPQMKHLDAVDFSYPLIDKGRTLPNGDHPDLSWIYGRIEEVKLQPPYALITAGESLHWMEWDIVLPLFRLMLSPHGYLVLVERRTERNPWDDELQALIQRFSTNQKYVPYDLAVELEQRNLFKQHGTLHTHPVPFVQSFHSRNGFSRERMGEEAAKAFDEDVRKRISPLLQDGELFLSVVGTVLWGLPQKPSYT